MAEREPGPEVTTVAARRNFADLVNRAVYGKERVVLTRRGKRIAALVPIDDVRLLEQIEDERDIRTARKALREYRRTGKTISWERIKAGMKL